MFISGYSCPFGEPAYREFSQKKSGGRQAGAGGPRSPEWSAFILRPDTAQGARARRHAGEEKCWAKRFKAASRLGGRCASSPRSTGEYLEWQKSSSPLSGRLVVPGHPVFGMSLSLRVVILNFVQVLERVGATELACVD